MATIRPAPRLSRFHPIHGILSAFPLAFFTDALVTDIIYVNSTQMQWANFSVWQISFLVAWPRLIRANDLLPSSEI